MRKSVHFDLLSEDPTMDLLTNLVIQGAHYYNFESFKRETGHNFVHFQVCFLGGEGETELNCAGICLLALTELMQASLDQSMNRLPTTMMPGHLPAKFETSMMVLQLRNLLWATSAFEFYYSSHNTIRRYNSLSKKSQEAGP